MKEGGLPQEPGAGKPWLNRLRSIRRHRFAVLFGFLLVSLPVVPYADVRGFGYFAFRAVGVAVTLLTVWAASIRRGLIALVLVLMIPSILQHIAIGPRDSGSISLLGRVLSLVFDLIVIATIFHHVYTPGKPDRECVLGALCIYLLIGFAFSNVYGIVLSHSPAAFYLDPAVNLHTVPSRFDLVYFSFGTMTALGTPGITAVDPLPKAVSLLEAICGILYLAVLISRLIAGYRSAIAE